MRPRRSTTAAFIAALALTWAGAASAYAQTDTDTTIADFAAATPAQTYVIPSGATDGDVLLNPALGDEFSDAALPADWSSSQWSPPDGTADVTGGALVVDGAAAGPTATYSAGRWLEFTATFGAAPFQHVGFGVDFNVTKSWAMFSTGGGSLATGLWARTRSNSGTGEDVTRLDNDPLHPIDPLVPHRYRIVWTATAVTYFVDGVLVTGSASSPTVDQRPLVSDLNSGGEVVNVDWLRMGPYASSGTLTSRVFDAGDSRTLWQTVMANATAPTDTSVALETRTGPTATPDGSWSPWEAAGTGGAIASPIGRRYAQYRATLATADTDLTPVLHSVTITHTVDETAPTTTLDPVTVTGNDAHVAFSSEPDVTFECSLDGAAFQACTSPQDYADLPEGAHTFKARATDQVGNLGAAAQRDFTVDTTAPTTTIDPVTVTGTTAHVAFSSEPDATFECSLDNAAFTACTSPQDYAGLAEGAHSVKVRATDGFHNVGTAAERDFTVDTTAPTTTIDPVTVTGTSAHVEFSSEPGATFECSLDNAAFTACTSPQNYAGLGEGAHTLKARATDQIGNHGATAERTFNVDTTAPTTTISDPAVTGTTARIVFSSEPGATFECSLDNAAFTACTSPHDYTGLAVCSHTVKVRATDGFHNVGTAVERSFTIAAPHQDPPASQPPATVKDLSAPKIRPLTRSATASRAGKVKLALACPDTETSCRITVKLQYRGGTIASKTITVNGDASRTATLKLKRKLRTALAHKGKLTVHALTTARDAAGNVATTDTRIKLRAPK